MANKRKGKAQPISPSKRRRIREAEGRMQQGQTGGLPIDATATVAAEGEDAGFSSRVGDKDKAFGMKNGGRVRGAGVARKGVRQCKMR